MQIPVQNAENIDKQKEMAVNVTAPSNQIIYGASLLSIILSLLFLRRSAGLANFIGLWVPSILSLGVLLKENQILKLERRHAAV